MESITLAILDYDNSSSDKDSPSLPYFHLVPSIIDSSDNVEDAFRTSRTSFKSYSSWLL